VYIAPDGIAVHSYVEGEIVNATAAQTAVVTISTKLQNVASAPSTSTIQHSIYDTYDLLVAHTSTTVVVSAQSSVVAQASVQIGSHGVVGGVQLWSAQTPALYRMATTVFVEGDSGNDDRTTSTNTANDNDTFFATAVDRANTSFGVRHAVMAPSTGLQLNGRRVRVRGVCNHADFAGLGVGLPRRVDAFRVAAMKAMGANAWRMSHNPPPAHLLELTDSMGLMVWDETRQFDERQSSLDDASAMVRRDRNHPSILWWSMCNEFGCHSNSTEGFKLAHTFAAEIAANDANNTCAGGEEAGVCSGRRAITANQAGIYTWNTVRERTST
jgi:beta-galactosidase/beta-glucuronidase